MYSGSSVCFVFFSFEQMGLHKQQVSLTFVSIQHTFHLYTQFVFNMSLDIQTTTASVKAVALNLFACPKNNFFSEQGIIIEYEIWEWFDVTEKMWENVSSKVAQCKACL